MMTRVLASLAVAGVVLTLTILASPAAAAPCLPDGSCLPGPAADPCAPVDGTDLFICLEQLPDLPVDVPPMPADTPELPPPHVVPARPTGFPAEAVPTADVPTLAPAPDTAVPESASSSADAGPDRPPSSSGGGGDGSLPASIDNSSAVSRPAAVTRAARSFTLLFVLAALVGAYLLVQGRLDARDPKLVAAPIDGDDELISFG